MSENRLEIAVGGVVLALAVGFAVFLAQSTGLSGSSSSYPISASFRSAEGISVGTDIRLAGVKIGTIRDLKLNSETYGGESILAVKNVVRIPDDSALAVASEGLLGGSFIEVIPGASLDYLEAGDEIIDTQGSVSLIQLLLKFVSSGQN